MDMRDGTVIAMHGPLVRVQVGEETLVVASRRRLNWEGGTPPAARLVVLDGHRGAWGQLSVDQVVLSDREGTTVLDDVRPLADELAWWRRVEAVAGRRGADAARLAALRARYAQ